MILILVFIVINIFVNALFNRNVDKMSERDMADISQKNAAKISTVVKSNEMSAVPLVRSVQSMLAKSDTGEKTFQSLVVDQKLTETRYNEEQLILNHLWSLVEADENIEGAAVFFEPNAFQSDIEQYEPFITPNDAANGTAGTLDYAIFKDFPYYTDAVSTKEAAKLVDANGVTVSEGNQLMKDLAAAMADITDKSNKIQNIIKTIDDIAFQTNILSLNAAIEAARAGQMGKGFAVVADEVGALAQKSAESAKNTTVLIEETLASIEKGAALTTETAEKLNEVQEKSGQISSIITNISEASNKQSEDVKHITTGLEQISSVVQMNSATAEQSAAASQELSTQAKTMNQLVGAFKLKSDTE